MGFQPGTGDEDNGAVQIKTIKRINTDYTELPQQDSYYDENYLPLIFIGRKVIILVF